MTLQGRCKAALQHPPAGLTVGPRLGRLRRRPLPLPPPRLRLLRPRTCCRCRRTLLLLLLLLLLLPLCCAPEQMLHLAQLGGVDQPVGGHQLRGLPRQVRPLRQRLQLEPAPHGVAV